MIKRHNKSNRECSTPEQMTQLGGCYFFGWSTEMFCGGTFGSMTQGIDSLGCKMVLQKNPYPVWSVGSNRYQFATEKSPKVRAPTMMVLTSNTGLLLGEAVNIPCFGSTI